MTIDSVRQGGGQERKCSIIYLQAYLYHVIYFHGSINTSSLFSCYYLKKILQCILHVSIFIIAFIPYLNDIVFVYTLYLLF